MWEMVGMSGVIARVNAMWSGWSQPVIHVGDRTPSVKRSSQRMGVVDILDLTERVSYCAPLDFFKRGKGKMKLRDTFL